METSARDPRSPARPANRYFLSLRDSPSPLDFFSLAALVLLLWSSMAYSTGVWGKGAHIRHRPGLVGNLTVPVPPLSAARGILPSLSRPRVPLTCRPRFVVSFPALCNFPFSMALRGERCCGFGPAAAPRTADAAAAPLTQAPYLSRLCSAACRRIQQYRVR